MKDNIRVAIYGAGRFANRKHLPNLARIDGVDIVAVCDINENTARDTADHFGIPSVYTSGHEMLAKEEIDALWSIVPAFARTDVEAAAASRGIHIFSEKPQALEMPVARRIDDAIRKADVLSIVCFRERYRPIFQEARRLLVDKEIVHIRFQSTRPLPGLRENGGWHSEFEKGASAFFDWGPHAVDYTRFITGLDVTTAQAYFKHDPDRHREPTSSSFNFQMSNGATMAMTFVCASSTQPPQEPYFLVYYEDGYLGIHGYKHIDIDGEIVYNAEEYDPWFELDRRFCDAVRSGDEKHLLNDYHDGLYSLAPILAGWESARLGGEPIDVEQYLQA